MNNNCQNLDIEKEEINSKDKYLLKKWFPLSKQIINNKL